MAKYEGKQWFTRHMETSTGLKNMNVNGSTANKQYSVGPPPAGEVWNLWRALVYIQDSGAFRAEGYGAASSTGLTNGLLLKVVGTTGNEVLDLLDGHPIKRNAGWALYCYDADLKSWSVGDEMLVARWTFNNAGVPIVLSSTEKLQMTVRDNLTGLVEQSIVIQGNKDN